MFSKIMIFFGFLLYTTMAMPIIGPDDSKMARFLKQTDFSIKSNKHRLPRNTVPRVYMIELDPDVLGERFTFKGNSTIIFEVLQPTTSVTVHKSNKINVEEKATELIHPSGKIEHPFKQTWYPQNEFYTMKFEDKLDTGNYTLKFKWTGIDSSEDWFDRYTGFYRVENTDENDKKSYVVTTHFEPTGARNAFPCWDEPGLKAEFEISIKHFPNYTALSNMPAKNSEQTADGKVITHFDRSVKMSPYLPCILVADYKAIKNENGNITFYGMESHLEYLKYALEISEKVIPIMESYTSFPYTMPKLDQITIPKYAATAMEHWGLVSYITSSVALMNTTLIPNIVDKDEIAFIISHELAHQWFGNLVSPKWWDDLWLNEAFADYFQYKVVDRMFPHWRTMDYYVIEHVDSDAYTVEYYTNTPIKYNPRTKMQIEEMFSGVTYVKGSAVVHMMEHILTEEVFLSGIQNYLQKHQFTAVVTNDLWTALQKAYDKKFPDEKMNIKSTMEPWILQTGYPIIEVTRDNTTGDVVITQKPGGLAPMDNTWRIPINYATKSNPDFSSTTPMMWMEEDQKELRIPNIPENDWIIVNIQQRGFYRVEYDMENWQRLIDYLHTDDFKNIHPINRAQLVEDVYRMYIHDNSKLDMLIKMTLYLYQDRDYLVWLPAGKMLKNFDRTLRNTGAEELFGIYSLIVTNEVTEHLGFEHREGDEHSAIKIRSILAPLVCKYEHADCKAFAKRMFETFLDNPTNNAFPPSEWEWIICTGLQESNESVWDTFMALDVESIKYLRGDKHKFISCTNNNDLRLKYIAKTMETNSNVHPDDITEMFDNFFQSNHNDVEFAMDYIRDHYEEIKKYYQQYDDSNLLLLIGRMELAINTQDQLDKFKAFIKPKKEELKKLDRDTYDMIMVLKDEDFELKAVEAKSSNFQDQINKHIGTDVLKSGKELQESKDKK